MEGENATFANDAHRATWERVRDFMAQLYGESAVCDAAAQRFTLTYGSAQVQVSVWPGDGSPSVSVYAFVVRGATGSEELYRFLLTQNAALPLGAFCLADDGTIIFQYTVAGATLDKAELATAIDAVKETTDRLDDEIVGRFGGQTARASGADSAPRTMR